MARVNLTNLNKTGTYLFWESNWENLYNFSNKLNKSLVINLVINIFLNNKILHCNFFNSKSFFRDIKLFNFEESNLINKKTLKIKPLLTSKVWFIEYQGWCVLSLFIYKYKKFFKKHNNESLNFLKFYYYYFYLLKSKNTHSNNYKNIFD
uniref:ribosomal protein S3 n=1 Tax=Cryptocaryon irritans TaxID=153251 RepID=UPI0022FD9E96|nr:ribosomal protein S3 [Cryptocaryon irritans]WBP62314.1 ribosomal protein S3 [Cryptocaryon irritans]